MKKPSPPLTRVAWVEGSRLTRRDLADAIEHEARMLALHIGTMHATWGVAAGLRIAIGPDLHSVRVSSGSAFTARGEPVVIAGATTIEGPRGAGSIFDLLLSPASHAACGCGCDRPLTCTGATIASGPTLRWSAASTFGLGTDVRLGAEIPIGRVTRSASGILSKIDYSQRRTSTSLARPHVFSGVARAGQAVWHQTNLDLFARIDTDAAGFTGSPTYYAAVGNDPPWASAVVGPLVRIEQQTPRSFVVRLGFGSTTATGVLLPLLLEQARKVDVQWMGVEETSGCPPTFTTLVHQLNPWIVP